MGVVRKLVVATGQVVMLLGVLLPVAAEIAAVF
jgi:hypothetical protein